MAGLVSVACTCRAGPPRCTSGGVRRVSAASRFASSTFEQTNVAQVGTAVITFIFLLYVTFSFAFTPLLVAYPVEIWQYELRARGHSVMWATTALATFVNIFVNLIPIEAIGWKYYLVYVFILTGGFVVFYFTFPETRGHSLEEIARVFDGEDAALPQEGALAEKAFASGDTKHVDDVAKVDETAPVPA